MHVSIKEFISSEMPAKYPGWFVKWRCPADANGAGFCTEHSHITAISQPVHPSTALGTVLPRFNLKIFYPLGFPHA